MTTKNKTKTNEAPPAKADINDPELEALIDGVKKSGEAANTGREATFALLGEVMKLDEYCLAHKGLAETKWKNLKLDKKNDVPTYAASLIKEVVYGGDNDKIEKHAPDISKWNGAIKYAKKLNTKPEELKNFLNDVGGPSKAVSKFRRWVAVGLDKPEPKEDEAKKALEDQRTQAQTEAEQKAQEAFNAFWEAQGKSPVAQATVDPNRFPSGDFHLMLAHKDENGNLSLARLPISDLKRIQDIILAATAQKTEKKAGKFALNLDTNMTKIHTAIRWLLGHAVADTKGRWLAFRVQENATTFIAGKLNDHTVMSRVDVEVPSSVMQVNGKTDNRGLELGKWYLLGADAQADLLSPQADNFDFSITERGNKAKSKIDGHTAYSNLLLRVQGTDAATDILEDTDNPIGLYYPADDLGKPNALGSLSLTLPQLKILSAYDGKKPNLGKGKLKDKPASKPSGRKAVVDGETVDRADVKFPKQVLSFEAKNNKIAFEPGGLAVMDQAFDEAYNAEQDPEKQEELLKNWKPAKSQEVALHFGSDANLEDAHWSHKPGEIRQAIKLINVVGTPRVQWTCGEFGMRFEAKEPNFGSFTVHVVALNDDKDATRKKPGSTQGIGEI